MSGALDEVRHRGREILTLGTKTGHTQFGIVNIKQKQKEEAGERQLFKYGRNEQTPNAGRK